MTTPALHTPTPWRIAPPSKGKNRICRAANLQLIADANNYNEQADANAAFIVRVANAWYDLAALRARVAELEAQGAALAAAGVTGVSAPDARGLADAMETGGSDF